MRGVDVMHGTAGPFCVALVKGQNSPEETVMVVPVDLCKLHYLTHHQRHDQAAIGRRRRDYVPR